MAASNGVFVEHELAVPEVQAANEIHSSVLGKYDVKASAESIYDEEISIKESDRRHKQVFKGWALLVLAYQSTGVIYGDIGTSPLYVYSSTFSSPPSYDDLLGSVSLIIWTLTLVVTIKYVFIVLNADDEGEGGTFAMYNLLSRYCNITSHDNRSAYAAKIERYTTNDLRPSCRSARSFLEKSRAAQLILKILAVFGVSLIMADGILTPAQSVLGAIQGLNVIDSTLSSGTVVGVSCAILIILYVLQPLGIHRLSFAFAPIVVIWLLFNLSFGIYNLVIYDHSVLKAFSPYFAGAYFVRNKTEGWTSLGGILLAFTGVETLFADMGAFSQRAVQLSWLCLAYPSLLFAYIGQAAYIAHDPTAYSNPFFKTVPHGMFYPSLVLAILAAVVASQATITGAFQLLSQVMNTSYFPHIEIIYTSDKVHGQVYIPWANWLMMIGTVIVTAVYSNTTKLGQAYGVCVILVTFLTTNMVAIIALVVWCFHWALVFAVWLPFITLDGLYLTSAMQKVPNGAWFTILLATILSSIFVLWRYGKEKQWSAERKGISSLNKLVIRDDQGVLRLAENFGGRQLTSIKGISIFFDKAADIVPTVYEEFLRKFEAQPEILVFLHLRALQKPYVSTEDKFTIAKTSLPNCYRMVIRHGYHDKVVTENLGAVIYQELHKFIIATSAPKLSEVATSFDFSSTKELGQVSGRLQALENAFSTQLVYIVGKEQMRLLPSRNNIIQRIILNAFLWIRDNTRAKVASMKIPIEKLVEVGFVKEI